MNIQNLRKRYPKLIANMKGGGYSNDYIARVKREIAMILANAEDNDWQSYSDIYRDYVKQGMSKGALHHRLACLGIIERFDTLGEFPNGRTRQKIVAYSAEQHLSPEFKRVIDTYRDAELRRGTKRSNTIYCQSGTAASFLYALQCTGISKIEEITQQSVMAVFITENGSLRWSSSCKGVIAGVFKANVPSAPKVFTRLIAYLPDLRRVRRNIQYLTDGEIIKIKYVLTNKDSGLSLRDTAIGTLALNYGLRSGDIAALRLDDIDLESEKINIIQQKTSVPLELPLNTAVGNALYDYVTLERPKSDCEYVFLSESRPIRRLVSGSLSNIAIRIMKAAGIRQNTGDRKGFHIFRHRLATALLANGVAQPIISEIAGHTSPDSLEAYLSADFKHLKECAISIERFPLQREVSTDA